MPKEDQALEEQAIEKLKIEGLWGKIAPLELHETLGVNYDTRTEVEAVIVRERDIIEAGERNIIIDADENGEEDCPLRRRRND